MSDNNIFEYTEADVEKALHFLSIHAPKFATPENAVLLLEYLRERTLEIEASSKEDIDSFIQDLESR